MVLEEKSQLFCLLMLYLMCILILLLQKKTPKSIKLTFYLLPDPSTGIKPIKKYEERDFKNQSLL